MSLRESGISRFRRLSGFIGLLGLTACVAPSAREGAPPPSPAEIERLAIAVSTVTGADGSTSRRFARRAYAASRELAREYKLVWPPLLHNSLVNAGMRTRGLCHQFADDLAARLLADGPWPWELRPIVAREDSYWRAHHAIVIGQAGQDLSEWLLLDPWRHSGQLRWSIVGEDDTPWVWWEEKGE